MQYLPARFLGEARCSQSSCFWLRVPTDRRVWCPWFPVAWHQVLPLRKAKWQKEIYIVFWMLEVAKQSPSFSLKAAAQGLGVPYISVLNVASCNFTLARKVMLHAPKGTREPLSFVTDSQNELGPTVPERVEHEAKCRLTLPKWCSFKTSSNMQSKEGPANFTQAVPHASRSAYPRLPWRAPICACGVWGQWTDSFFCLWPKIAWRGRIGIRPLRVQGHES